MAPFKPRPMPFSCAYADRAALTVCKHCRQSPEYSDHSPRWAVLMVGVEVIAVLCASCATLQGEVARLVEAHRRASGP